jgi:glycerophosphoryl diester phosphodiesterase
MAVFLSNPEKKFHLQGHRGVRGLMPENTIEGCIEAVRLGFEALEIDVVCSLDGQILVSHDPWMSSEFCSNPNGEPISTSFLAQNLKNTEGANLYKMPYDLIRQFDCGMRGNPRFPNQKKIKTYKPTLIELVEAVSLFCKTHHYTMPFLNIEIKSHQDWYGKYVPMPNDFTRLLNDPLSILPLDTYYISSFDPIFLRAFKQKNPKTTLAFLTENHFSLTENLKWLGFKPTIYSPYYHYLNDATIRRCKKMGIDLIVWTVNDLVALKRLKNAGVRGVISDYP